MGLIKLNALILTKRTKSWCRAPYPGHPKGCPNYWGKCFAGGKDQLILADRFIDVNKPMYIVYNEFDLAAHMARMKEKHPTWSERQLRNIYYWQNRSHAQLNKLVIQALKDIYGQPHSIVVLSGEGNGVNLYATCAIHGLKLDKIRTMKTCRHMVIIGKRRIVKRYTYASLPNVMPGANKNFV
jgi:hypothetical protein